MRHLLWLSLAVGCAKERDPAPKELDTLCHDLMREFEQDASLATTVQGIADWLADEADSDEAWEGLRLTNLVPDDVSDLEYPRNTDFDVHAGLANAAVSPFGVIDHAGLIVDRDQTWTDPKSFDVYERTVDEGDAAAFTAGDGLVRTSNEIVKSGAFGVTIPYRLRKDYRWVELTDGTLALAARSWLEKTGCSDNGKNCVMQSWGIEVLHGAKNNQTRRLYAVWLDVRTEADSFMSEDGKIGLMASGNQDILEATDEELANRSR